MFTGIIEEMGKVIAIEKGAKSAVLTIGADNIFEDLKIGDSVATNGVCLTVKEIRGSTFKADVMHITLMRSALGQLKVGSKVNLERAMPINGRFGGHIVTGHIDGIGKIKQIVKEDQAIWYTISADQDLLQYMIEKGSIAVDGISLTIARLNRDSFSVSLIPHTAQHTVLGEKRIGEVVNLENDMIGKYVAKFHKKSIQIDEAFLHHYGF